jgi:hypothetical protein
MVGKSGAMRSAHSFRDCTTRPLVFHISCNAMDEDIQNQKEEETPCLTEEGSRRQVGTQYSSMKAHAFD